jgi:hypothetical protein
MSKTKDILLARKEELRKEIHEIDIAIKSIEDNERLFSAIIKPIKENFKTCPRCTQQNYATAKQCAYCGAGLIVPDDTDDNPMHSIGYGRGDDR